MSTGLVKLVLQGLGWLAWRLCIHTAPCLVPAVLSRTCQFFKWAEDQYITCYISLSSLADGVFARERNNLCASTPNISFLPPKGQGKKPRKEKEDES